MMRPSSGWRLMTFIFMAVMLIPITSAVTQSYIVYFGAHSHDGGLKMVDFHQLTKSHYDFLSLFLGSRQRAEEAIFYSYTSHINGFAAMLEEEDAVEIARHPSVVSIFPDRPRKLLTTRSWEFLGLEDDNGFTPSTSAWEKARYGEDVIIGNLDAGVWPESKSFEDSNFGPIPKNWRGKCENKFDDSFLCNRKLIGARYFNKGYAAAVGPLNSSFNTPRDMDGHGTHTLSTAGGNFVEGVSVSGQGNGTAKGGSPKSRVAAYKVCWELGCFEADILAAFDAAISDGVNVLSVSLGGETPEQLFRDGVSIGSFHAVSEGIVVVCSAGNSGPAPGNVVNISPWQINVGASTMDRRFVAEVVLANKVHLQGVSLSEKALPENSFYPLIIASDAKLENVKSDDAALCKVRTLDRQKMEEKILICLRGQNARVEKGEQALLAGAVGMILANVFPNGNLTIADAHLLPASHVSYINALVLLNYTKSTRSPKAHISSVHTTLKTKPAPLMVTFSSRGPNKIIEEILKPDITAPGVDVIVAYTEVRGPTGLKSDKRVYKFNSISGTSMSCPHISGVVGLLKALYPSWSPAAIRSAIMTTASVTDNMGEPIKDESNGWATPFDYGAGHIDPNRATNPGLVYDLTRSDYLNFLCALNYNKTEISYFTRGKPYRCPKKPINWMNFNYPSITVPRLSRSTTVRRTLKNVGGHPAIYTARVVEPKGISIIVNPKHLTFNNTGEEKNFCVTLQAKKDTMKYYSFGRLIWSDNRKQYTVVSPISVKAA